MKKRAGVSLVEILIALGVLAVVVPVSLNAFGTVFTAEFRIHERVEKASCAEWWFNQLNFPVQATDLNKAPQCYGKMNFTWEASSSAHDALRITLRVTNGEPSDVPFTESRVY